MKPTRYWRLLFIYLFIFTWFGNKEKTTQATTVTRYLCKIKFFCSLIPFHASKSSQCNYLTDNPFFTDHTFFRLFSRMSTKPLLSFNNYPISLAYWSRAVIDAQLLPLIYLRTDISLTTQKNCFLCFVQNDTQFWKVCTFYEIIFD